MRELGLRCLGNSLRGCSSRVAQVESRLCMSLKPVLWPPFLMQFLFSEKVVNRYILVKLQDFPEQGLLPFSTFFVKSSFSERQKELVFCRKLTFSRNCHWTYNGHKLQYPYCILFIPDYLCLKTNVMCELLCCGKDQVAVSSEMLDSWSWNPILTEADQPFLGSPDCCCTPLPEGGLRRRRGQGPTPAS